ncbi:MAG: putative O-methyltransferase [Thermoleophilia bacterium]|nr:putative O-methyltransferase [Thermoleophilia bacterium]
MAPLDDRTHAWMQERFWADDPLLARARERFAAAHGPLIEVPNDTGALLATLVRTLSATRVLEIGTLFGYSAVWMARAMPAAGTIDTLELEEPHAALAEQLFDEAGVAEMVTVHRGAALDTLAQLEGPYDLAFIDADKERYPAYLDRAVELVRPGGLIVADNVIWSGRVADPSQQTPDVLALRAYLDRARSHALLDTNVLPVGDGVAVSVRR